MSQHEENTPMGKEHPLAVPAVSQTPSFSPAEQQSFSELSEAEVAFALEATKLTGRRISEATKRVLSEQNRALP